MENMLMTKEKAEKNAINIKQYDELITFEKFIEMIANVDENDIKQAEVLINSLVKSNLDTAEQETVLAKFKKEFKNGRVINRMFKDAKSARTLAIRQHKSKQRQQTLLATGGHLSLTEKIPKESFPIVTQDENGEITGVTTHYKNTQHILDMYGISIGYNQITKRASISHEDFDSDSWQDMSAEVALGRVLAQVAINRLDGYNDATVMMHLNILTMDRQQNPVVEFLSSTQWDGIDRIGVFCDLIGVDNNIKQLRDYVVRKWLIQACAAADHAVATPLNERKRNKSKPKFEYILVLQGAQGLEKTKFVESMLPMQLRQYFKEGVLLDPSNKDSISLFIQNWIVELGELDATFKRSQISHLKGFMSNSSDTYRAPYGKTNSNYQRRTCVVATVNPEKFLKDTTGNRRFWTLAVKQLTLPEDAEIEIDIDQLWAQCWSLYIGGEQWWPNEEWQQHINGFSNNHLYLTDRENDIAEKLYEHYGEFTEAATAEGKVMTVSEIRDVIEPHNANVITLTEIGKVLAKINLKPNGENQRVGSKTNKAKWLMPKVISKNKKMLQNGFYKGCKG